jgi:hypothetical protein
MIMDQEGCQIIPNDEIIMQRTLQLDDGEDAEEEEDQINSCQSRNHNTQGGSRLSNGINNSEYFSFSKNEKPPSNAYNSMRGSGTIIVSDQ